ncbi:hypothetical protein ACFKHW_04440 [Bradyrhizobium lupini]|uniref:hypothetical protein n=1 Tax=Rhizobium lupini TaxID=136996 RepID=UPI00366E9292
MPDETDSLLDEHIAADYALLEQELQSNNPGLAARTRVRAPRAKSSAALDREPAWPVQSRYLDVLAA